MESCSDDILGVVSDRWGRMVVFTADRLWHVQQEHPEVSSLDVKQTIQRADTRTIGNRPDTEVLWCQTVGNSRWMKVVVAYDGTDGSVRTAYPSHKGPRDEDRIE